MILIAARSTSSRFPCKHLAPLADSTVLDVLISRVSQVMPFAFLIPEGDPLKEALESREVPYFQGPEDDVLRRHLLAVGHYELSWFIRVTGDCPLISPQDLLWMANACVNLKADYGTNCRYAGTDGQEIEFVSRRMIFRMNADAAEPEDREHVTTWIKSNWDELVDYGFKMYEAPIQYGWQATEKLSIDTSEDLERVEALMQSVKKNRR